MITTDKINPQMTFETIPPSNDKFDYIIVRPRVKTSHPVISTITSNLCMFFKKKIF